MTNYSKLRGVGAVTSRFAQELGGMEMIHKTKNICKEKFIKAILYV